MVKIRCLSGHSADGGSDGGGCQHRKECGKKRNAGEFSAREQGSGGGDCQTTAAAESLGDGPSGFYKSDVKIRGRGTA